MTTLTEFVEEQIADGAVIGGSVVVTAADGSGYLVWQEAVDGVAGVFELVAVALSDEGEVVAQPDGLFSDSLGPGTPEDSPLVEVPFAEGFGLEYQDADGALGRLDVTASAGEIQAVSTTVIDEFSAPEEEAPEELILPTQGDDVLAGTSGDDVIDALGGNDAVKGLDGQDWIIGGAGDDSIDGGRGDDALIETEVVIYDAGSGDPLVELQLSGGLYGGAGSDSINGRDGSDYIEGGDGDDDLRGGIGSDSSERSANGDLAGIYGGEGDDLLMGGGKAQISSAI